MLRQSLAIRLIRNVSHGPLREIRHGPLRGERCCCSTQRGCPEGHKAGAEDGFLFFYFYFYPSSPCFFSLGESHDSTIHFDLPMFVTITKRVWTVAWVINDHENRLQWPTCRNQRVLWLLLKSRGRCSGLMNGVVLPVKQKAMMYDAEHSIERNLKWMLYGTCAYASAGNDIKWKDVPWSLVVLAGSRRPGRSFLWMGRADEPTYVHLHSCVGKCDGYHFHKCKACGWFPRWTKMHLHKDCFSRDYFVSPIQHVNMRLQVYRIYVCICIYILYIICNYNIYIFIEKVYKYLLVCRQPELVLKKSRTNETWITDSHS